MPSNERASSFSKFLTLIQSSNSITAGHCCIALLYSAKYPIMNLCYMVLYRYNVFSEQGD